MLRSTNVENISFIFLMIVVWNCHLHCSTRTAFESKLTKSSKSTDFRISPTLCTMFNVMVDAKDQSAKLCAMEMGQEVNWVLSYWVLNTTSIIFSAIEICKVCYVVDNTSPFLQKQFHTQIDELIEESVRDMIQYLVAKVLCNTRCDRCCTTLPSNQEKKHRRLLLILFFSCFQFVAILESVLAKISRYDEGTLFSSFLSFTVRRSFFCSATDFLLHVLQGNSLMVWAI